MCQQALRGFSSDYGTSGAASCSVVGRNAPLKRTLFCLPRCPISEQDIPRYTDSPDNNRKINSLS